MPKGDRLKLKADPEDGTTPVANLLLEAVAMAKISGLQKGAIVYLWRRTYGWIGADGKRKKEDKITLLDWCRALDRGKSRVSTALSDLEQKQIIFRRQADVWGGYYYSLNTNISQWNSDSINLAKLSEMVTVAHFGTVPEYGTVPTNENSSPKRNGTVVKNGTEQLSKTELPTLYKENLNKDKEKEGLNISSPFGKDLANIFKELDHNLRGYKPSVKRKAEAASILRMLKAGYTAGQIIKTWQNLKEDNFYADKELWMMTIEGQIGALVNKKNKTGNHPSQEKFAKQKFDHMVRR